MNRRLRQNLAKHGAGFAAAFAVFHDPFALDLEERKMDYGELRSDYSRNRSTI